MADEDGKRKLLVENKLRLQILEEQRARFGYSTPAEILTEIDHIKAETERLQRELGHTTTDQQPSPSASEHPGSGKNGPSTTNSTANFYAPVGAVHSGSGDIYINNSSNQADSALPITKLRRVVSTQAPPELRQASLRKVADLEDAVRTGDQEEFDAALGWLSRRIPSLAGAIEECRRWFGNRGA